jgi:hypothetical protein
MHSPAMKHLYALFCSAVGLTLAVSSLAQPVPEMNSVTTRPATVLADPGPLVPPVPLPDPPVPAALSTGPAALIFACGFTTRAPATAHLARRAFLSPGQIRPPLYSAPPLPMARFTKHSRRAPIFLTWWSPLPSAHQCSESAIPRLFLPPARSPLMASRLMHAGSLR